MKVHIIQVPYDSGRENYRQGLGPAHFLSLGIDKEIESLGLEVEVERLRVFSGVAGEVSGSFEVNRCLAERVRTIVDRGGFPLVLSGNCNTALGTMSGLGPETIGVVWFDAHGEFNTPDTTMSGWLDGMPLAMATDKCWKNLLRTIPGYTPLPEDRIVLIGARDLDAEEERMLSRSAIEIVNTDQVTDPDQLIDAVADSFSFLRARRDQVYIHVDMDALDLGGHKANHLHPPGGTAPKLLYRIMRLACESFRVRGLGLASYDPGADRESMCGQVGVRLAKTILESRSRMQT